MKKVYLTFSYNGKKIAVECSSMEELRDVASDVYDYKGVILLDIIEDGKPAEGMVVVSGLDYWNHAFTHTLAR